MNENELKQKRFQTIFNLSKRVLLLEQKNKQLKAEIEDLKAKINNDSARQQNSP